MEKKHKLTIEQARNQVNQLMKEGFHWGPTTVQVMNDIWDMEDDTMVWAGTNFYGGVTGQREGVCGAISGLAIALGFLYRDTSGDPEKANEAREKARGKTDELVKQFKTDNGSIICSELIKVDFNNPEEGEAFKADPKNADICPGFVRYAVEKMMELDS